MSSSTISLRRWLVPAFALPLLVLFATVASAGDAWHLDYVGILAQERLDPVVSPNAVASHMHRVVGGSGFSAAYDYDRQVASSCTTLGIKADKSNYWMPQLYWFDTNPRTNETEFVPIPGAVRWYYGLNRQSPDVPVLPFPPGMRFLGGSPNNKDLSVSSFYSTYNCKTTDGVVHNPSSSFNFDTPCPYGMITNMYLPSCWDGINLYSEDGSHVVYPIGSPSNGHCPASNPWRIPSILLEYTWMPNNWAPGVAMKGHLAWANGDTTGAGIHADFTNGWDVDVLREALDHPGCINQTSQIPAQQCPVFGANFDMKASSNGCTPSTGILQEPFGNADMVPIPSLPGCNPLWSTGPKPTNCTSPAQTTKLNITPQQGTQQNKTLPASQQISGAKVPTAEGWSYYQCLMDWGGSPAFINETTFYYTQMTVDTCLNACGKSGYSWAAVDYAAGWMCHCAEALNTTGALANYDQCNQPCPGNSSQICGGDHALVAYHNNAVAGTDTNADSTNLTLAQSYIGCLSSSALPTLATYHYQINTMTNERCAQACVNQNASWAATSNTNICYCGSDFEFGSGTVRPDASCNTACNGNTTEMCGGQWTYSVFNVGASNLEPDLPDYPAGRVGCFADYSKKMLTGYATKSLTGMTVETCQGYCSELNFTYAGLELGQTCYCGNSYDVSQNPLPAAECNMPCTGNPKETCGGSPIIEIYQSNAGPVTGTGVTAAHPDGWLGCYSGSPTTLGNYTYQSFNAMTTDLCQKTCGQFNYVYGMLDVGHRCTCTNTMPATTKQPSAQSCTIPCAGNGTESCGGNGAFDLYAVASSIDASATRGAGWVGCYSTTSYNTTGLSFSTANMTVDFCQSSCREMGYGYAGATTGNRCYCSPTAPASSGTLPVSACTAACVGNSTQICGGSSQISVYTAAQGFLPASLPAGWVGCYSDPGSSTLLTSYSYSSQYMTSSLCRSTCASQKYAYAGTEAGNVCRCGNSVTSGTAYPSGMCSTACAGSAADSCGGSGPMMSVYTTANMTSTTPPANSTNTTSPSTSDGLLGCFSDYASFKASYSYSSNIMSAAICARACSARSYAYSGMWNGNYCGCSDTAPVAQLPMSACSSQCVTSTGTCGGPNSAVQAYAVAKTAAKGLLASPDANGYYGCYGDTASYLLGAYSWTSSAMTPLLCAQQCNSFGYSLSGVEYGSQCHCANNLTIGPWAQQYLDSDCSSSCAGDSSQKCGAGNRMSLYQVKSVPKLVDPAALVPGQNNYVGCFGRASVANASYSLVGANMTNTACRRVCAGQNYPLAATFGNYCYCSVAPATSFGNQQPESLCATTCSGSSTDICGGSWSLSFWKSSGYSYTAPAQFAPGYVGCYQDGTPKILNSFSAPTSSNTGANCQRICSAKGFALAGTEGNTCYCGNSVGSAILSVDSKCNVPCGGNPAEMCGSGSFLSLYNMTSAANPSPVTSASQANSTLKTPSPLNVTSSVSSTESRSAVTASASTTGTKSLNITVPLSTMPQSSRASSSVTSRASSSVSSLVTSSVSKPASASVSSKASSSAAAPTSAVTSRATASSSTPVSSSKTSAATSPVSSAKVTAATTSVSSSKPAVTSSASSSKLAVTSSASSSRATSSSSSTTGSASVSRNATVSVSATSRSVPGNTLIATSISSKPASSSATSSSRTTAKPTQATTSSSSSSSSSPPPAVPTPSAKSALMSSDGLVGCFANPPNDVTMSQAKMQCDTLTPGMCKVLCNAQGYSLAAVSNGNTCSCGASTSSLTTVSAGSCSAPCSGDSKQSCGGASSYAIYNAQSPTTKRAVERGDVPVTSRRSRSRSSFNKQVRKPAASRLQRVVRGQ